jgi:hypothetical protein
LGSSHPRPFQKGSRVSGENYSRLKSDLQGATGAAANQKPIRFGAYRWQGLWGWDDIPDSIRSQGSITRLQVLSLADEVRQGTRGPASLFLAAMIWGSGPGGLGPWRVGKMTDSEVDRETIREVIDTSTKGDWVASYGLLCPGHPPKLGPPFGTKLIYFAGYRAAPIHSRPLILDSVVGRALRKYGYSFSFNLYRLEDGRSLAGYRRYVELMNRLAEDLNERPGPDDLEAKLFLGLRG